MWLLNKKIIIIIILVFVVLIGVGFLVSLNPSVKIIKNSKDTHVLINNKPLPEQYLDKKEFEIKLNESKNVITFFEYGYLKKEISINASPFKKVIISYRPVKSQPLIEGLPITNTELGLIKINGYYNDFFEPTYSILGYETNPSRGLDILKSRGVDLKRVKTELVEDGD